MAICAYEGSARPPITGSGAGAVLVSGTVFRHRFPTPEETQVTERLPTGSDKLPTMSVQTLFDILLVLVALAVVWFASFTVLRLFKGQN